MGIHAIRLPRFLVPLGKLTLVPILLWMIGRNALSGDEFGTVPPDYFLVGVALLANQAALYVFAVRMHTVLGLFGIPISSFEAQRIHLQSIFYYFAVPMTVGLEISRYVKVKAIVGDDVRPMMIVSALLADRVIGALAAFTIAAVMFLFSSFLTRIHLDFQLALLLLIFLAVSALAIFVHRRIFDEIHRIIGLLRASKRNLFAVFVISVLSHAFFACGAYAGAQAFSLNISFEETLLVVCLAMLFVTLPVSFAGVSPVEAASVGLLLAFGLPNEQAILFAVIIYFLKFLAAVEGACWEFVEGGRAFVNFLGGANQTHGQPNTHREHEEEMG